MTATNMPPVTDAHRQAAFELLKLRDCGNLSTAMANPTYALVIEACARYLRTRDWLDTQAVAVNQNVRRFNPATGQWVTQRVQTGWADPATTQHTGRLL